jgi:hypothetical protein
MNAEKDTAARITAYLDQGAADLRAGTAYRLKQARAAALARLDPAYAPAPLPAAELAAAGTRGAGRRLRRAPLAAWMLALVVAVAIFGALQWHAVRQVHELQDLDAQLLASDLPIDAYLDRGFINWLKAEQL